VPDTNAEYLQEERDHQFGCLFGAESIIKSGILFQSRTDEKLWTQVIDIIYDLAKKKPWLREECGFILFNAVPALEGQDSYYAQSIIDKLQSSGFSKTPEGVAIWLAIHSRHESVDLPRGVWHHQDPLNRKGLSKLARVLNEAPIADPAHNGAEANPPKKGTWTTKLHFAWEVALSCLLNLRSPARRKDDKHSKRIAIADFWLECVDSKFP